LRNTGKGSFTDVTQESGVLTSRVKQDPSYGRPGQIFASADVNNDGFVDIYTTTAVNDLENPQIETSELSLGGPELSFSLGPEGSAARFAGQKSVPAGVAFTDFDRDGNIDLWVTHNMPGGWSWPLPDRLLKGDGSGHFDDVSIPRGVKTEGWITLQLQNKAKGHSWAWSAAACDLNNDGFPELLASSYGRKPNHLWRAELSDAGLIEYVNASIYSGYAFDDNQDWTDNLNAQCHCQDNPNDLECDKAPAPQFPEGFNLSCEGFKAAFGGNYRWYHPTDRDPANLGGNSGATVCFDINNDGFIDLLTSEIVHWDVGTNSDSSEILVNYKDPNVFFMRPGNESTGLTRKDEKPIWDHGDMTATVFDFDNDGWPDIYIGASDYPGNKGLLYHQSSKLKFELLSFDDYFEHNRAHGMAAADFDRDGDVDLVVGHSHMRCEGAGGTDCYRTTEVRLFENQMSPGSNWLQLRLEGGKGSNRMAIGARVTVQAGNITQTQDVDGGHGHFGAQRDFTLHFGLGSECMAKVNIVWPNKEATKQTLELKGNAIYTVKQGQGAETWEP
jgi:hypothetical protein